MIFHFSSIWARLRAWFRVVFPGVEEPATDLADPEHARRELLQFYRQISLEIVSHRDYESHVSGGVERDSPLVQHFDPDTYAARLIGHFRSTRLLAAVVENGAYFALPMTLLFPDEEIRDRLGWGLRRKLFNAVFLEMSSTSQTPVAELCKAYFERIFHTGIDIPGCKREDLTDGLRDALHELEVDVIKAQREAGMFPQLTAEEGARFLEETLKRLRVRNRRQLQMLLRRSGAVGAVASAVILLLLFVLVLVVDSRISALVHRLVPDAAPLMALIVPKLLAFVLALSMAVAFLRIGASRRGRAFRALLRAAAVVGLLTPEVTSGFFRKRFDVEWP